MTFKFYTIDLATEQIPSDIGLADCAVFSPPYFARDGWSTELMKGVGRLLQDKLRPGAHAWMVFGQIKEDFLRPFRSAEILGEYLIPQQTVIWVKSIAIDSVTHGHFQPISSPTLVNYTHEYIFHFSNGEPNPLDRLSVGVPYVDTSNLSRGTRGKNGNIRCNGDTWFIPYETTGAGAKKTHRHEFPAELVRRCCKLSGLKEGNTVIDPFCGGGTTAEVCGEMGFSIVTFDINEQAGSLAEARYSLTREARKAKL